MPFSILLDVLLALLLVITIGYAVSLNKKLGALRKHKDEMQELSLGFADATRRAENSIVKLKSTSETIKARMEKAENLQEDLIFLIDRGSSAADRLENHIRNLRDETGVQVQSTLPSNQLSSTSQMAASEINNTGTGIKSAPDDKNNSKKDTLAHKSLLTASKEEPKKSEPSDAEKDLLKALRSAG